MLQLCERHKIGEDNKDSRGRKVKLPLICPIVVYASDKAYRAPRSFWELFKDKSLAKALIGDEYLLVDLQKQSDNEIVKKQHLGMMEYMLKHIHTRDILQLWDNFLLKFKPSIILDKERGYVYIRWFLWYTDARVPEDKQEDLEKVIRKHLSQDEQEKIMRTIAQKYEDIGEARGKDKRNIEIAKNMLSNGYSIPEVSKITGLSVAKINELLVPVKT